MHSVVELDELGVRDLRGVKLDPHGLGMARVARADGAIRRIRHFAANVAHGALQQALALELLDKVVLGAPEAAWPISPPLPRLERTVRGDEDLRRCAGARASLGRSDRGLSRGLVRDAHGVQCCSAEDASKMVEHQAAASALSEQK